MESVKAQRVIDELEILRVLATLAQAVDDRDEARYQACFADDVMAASASGDPDSWLAVSSQEYAHRSIEAVSAMTWTHHKLCNPIVDLMGDRAAAKADVVVDMEVSGHEGRPEHLTIDEDELDELITTEMLDDGFYAEALDDHVARVCDALDLTAAAAARWRELPDPAADAGGPARPPTG